MEDVKEKKTSVGNTRRTVLDNLDWGTDEFVEEYTEKKAKAVLPDGVHKKSIYADIITLAWPTFIELTLASLANMVDMMMVGKISPEAISSVSIGMQPKFILSTIFMAMCTGTTALVARCRGANEPEQANHFLRQSLLLTFVLSAISTLIGVLIPRQLVLLMGKAEEVVIQGGVDYLKWQLYGLIPMALTFTITSALRGVGKNKVSIASIYAGSNGAGVITGTTSVTFTGNGANLTFNDEYGGVSGDCAYPQSFVKGERSLHFNDFSGKFDAPVVQKMDTVTFEGSNVEITSNRWKAAPISCWEFDIDSSVTWATAKNNSFAGDTLVFGETGDTLDAWEGLWCVIDSNSDALFDGLSGAGSVTLLGQIASWDGVSNWLSEDYKLYVDSSNHDLIVATNLI